MKTTSCIALLGCLWAAPALAQDEKGWVDVNLGVATAAEQTIATAASRTVFRETAAFGVGYDLPRGASFDFGGGYMATPVLGVGISIQGTAHQGFPALSIRIPHPNVFNAFASDTRPGDQELKRVLQSRESLVEREVVLIGALARKVDVNERYLHCSGSPLVGADRPTMVDKDAPDLASHQRKEMGAVFPVNAAPAERPDVRLVDEGGGLQCVIAPLGTKEPSGDSLQLGIQLAHQLFGRSWITLANPRQHRGHRLPV